MVMVTREARWARVGVAATVLAVVATAASAVSASADPDPGMSVSPLQVGAVSLAHAGAVETWDDATTATIPSALQGVAVRQVVPTDRAVFALTAAGNVVAWGASPYRIQSTVPAALTSGGNVSQVAANVAGTYAGAVTKSGTVVTWGLKTSLSNPLEVPDGLTGVVQLAFANNVALALKSDGTVVAWGSDDPTQGADQLAVPAGLHAVALTSDTWNVYALTTDGTVVGWGKGYMGSLNLPPSVSEAGNVRAVSGCGYSNVIAQLADGSIVMWGNNGAGLIPASVASAHAFALNPGSTSNCILLDPEGVFHTWYPDAAQEVAGTIPADLTGAAVAQFARTMYGGGAAIVTKMLRGEDPTIAGTASAGGTLTATPGTFSDTPDEVTGQWLVDGVPIPDATSTTLSVTTALAGKQITYESTATKAGQDAISSTSDPVTIAKQAMVSVTAGKSAYGKSSTVSVSVPGASGSVALSVDGKSVGTKALAGGKASFALAKTIAPGSHPLVASYAGDTTYSAATKSATLVVGKGTTSVPTMKLKASAKKAGTVTATVNTAAGLVKATGKAQLVLKGKGTKKVNLTVKNGKVTGKLPKLPKGAWKATLTYQGNTYYLSAKSKTVTVKSK